MSRGHDAGTVYIVDDDPAVRDGLSLLLRSAGFTIRAFASGSDFITAEREAGPGCVLLDLRMPGMDGMAVQAELAEQDSNLPVIFLTAHAQVPVAVTALQRGAAGFIEKPNFDHDDMLEQIRTAIAEHRIVLEQLRRQTALLDRIARLTSRERQVARLAAAGKANKVIASELGISERTVEVHRSRGMKKLELRSVADLVRIEPELMATKRAAEDGNEYSRN